LKLMILTVDPQFDRHSPFGGRDCILYSLHCVRRCSGKQGWCRRCDAGRSKM
jgi:hypothetical protein